MDEEKVYIKTQILKQDYRAVVYFNIFFKNRAFTVISAAGIIVAVVTLLQKFLGSPISNFMYYVSVLIIVCIIILFVTTEMLIRKYINSYKISIGADMELVIDNEKILYKLDNIKSSAEFSLARLYRVYETSRYFLIFINSQEAIVVRKFDMDLESINKLKNIFKQNNILK